MSTIVVLSVIAVAQSVFLVLLVLFLIVRRRTDQARRIAFVQGRDALAGPVREWLAAEGGVQPVVQALNALPSRAVVGYTSYFVGGTVPGEKRDDLAVALHDAPWVRHAIASAGSRRWWRRIEAARAIAVAGTPADRETVIRLLDDPQPAVAIAAVACLPRVADRALAGAVLDRLPSLQLMVRHYLSRTLGEIIAVVEPELVARLKPDAPADALAHWIALGAALNSQPVLAAAATLASHPAEQVRAAVADALRHVPTDATMRLLDALLRDTGTAVRDRAAAALGFIASPRALPMLRASMRDPSWIVRRRSALALAQLGDAGRTAVAELARDPDPYVANIATVVRGLSSGALLELADD